MLKLLNLWVLFLEVDVIVDSVTGVVSDSDANVGPVFVSQYCEVPVTSCPSFYFNVFILICINFRS